MLGMRAGTKLEKSPDGWEVKPLQRRTTFLSEEFLKGRGWRFDASAFFGGRVA